MSLPQQLRIGFLCLILLSGLAGWLMSAESAALASIACLAVLALVWEWRCREKSPYPDSREEEMAMEAGLRAWQDQLEERERLLVRRQSQLQEHLASPLFDEQGNPVTQQSSETAPTALIRLTDADREVQQLLRQEAELVYERIRKDEYGSPSFPDLKRIRADLLDLVSRIAAVYRPESGDPLLETSIEQLARSGSRLCLHVLSVTEQLPVDIRRKSLTELYAWIRHGVRAYGIYQSAAPWMTMLSRGLYAGRLVAGTNPISLAAWWAASEIGRRGAARAIESVVDRQAVAVLHDMIGVIGAEAASLFSPDHRFRNADWYYGAELSALLSFFPVSREALQGALTEIGQLTLSSEYDRIYLYRCIADHRQSVRLLKHPDSLSAEERQDVAVRLEQFARNRMHGVSGEPLEKYCEEFASRWATRISLSAPPQPKADSRSEGRVEDAVNAFRDSVLRQYDAVDSTLDREQQPGGSPVAFEPPDLDPSDPAVDTFLKKLLCTVSESELTDPFVLETLGGMYTYYRRPLSELQEAVGVRLREALLTRAPARAKKVISDLLPPVVSALHRALAPGESILWFEEDAEAVNETSVVVTAVAELPTSDHQTTNLPAANSIRLLVTDASGNGTMRVLVGPFEMTRVRGRFIDDLQLTGNLKNPHPGDSLDDRTLRLSGRFGRGYESRFEHVLATFPDVPPVLPHPDETSS